MKLFFVLILFCTFQVKAGSVFDCSATCYTEYPAFAEVFTVSSSSSDKAVALNSLDIDCIEDHFWYDNKYLRIEVKDLPATAEYNPSHRRLNKISTDYLTSNLNDLSDSVCSIRKSN